MNVPQGKVFTLKGNVRRRQLGAAIFLVAAICTYVFHAIMSRSCFDQSLKFPIASFGRRFRELSKDTWIWSKYGVDSGVFIAQQEHDFACLLLLEDVCHIFDPALGEYSGVWYFLQRSRDLSRLDMTKSVCTGYKKSEEMVRREQFFSAKDKRDLAKLEKSIGKFLSYAAAKRYLLRAQSKAGAVAAEWKIVQFIKGLFCKGGAEWQISDSLVVASRTDTHVGHLFYTMGGLMEVSKHFPAEKSGRKPPGVTLFFDFRS